MTNDAIVVVVVWMKENKNTVGLLIMMGNETREDGFIIKIVHSSFYIAFGSKP